MTTKNQVALGVIFVIVLLVVMDLLITPEGQSLFSALLSW